MNVKLVFWASVRVGLMAFFFSGQFSYIVNENDNRHNGSSRSSSGVSGGSGGGGVCVDVQSRNAEAC